ncbi:MAG TPA: NAD-dependent epimerase/dehydratase family protein [Actinomycetales bacterium]|jgi:nucleoside-diphosphate-sugar epimerase
MGRVLVLGGTAWLGREITTVALARGHEVTCLARGEAGDVAAGAQLVRADRAAPDAYDQVREQDWDEVVDVSWQPGMVRSAVGALAGRAGHWTYVSSCSVYADHSLAMADESSPLLPALPADRDEADRDVYGEAKVACEEAVVEELGERALLVRAGLIGGPGDLSDRFGYWVGRYAVAGPDPVLAPDAPQQPTQTIDARDLAAWVVMAGEAGRSGPVNAVGEQRTLAEVLDAARGVAGSTGPTVRADPKWLQDNEVDGWAGPRSLPLWTPWPEFTAIGARSDRRSVELGLQRRPLESTLVDTLTHERRLGLDRERKAGLSRTDELELLDRWAARESLSD